jgi:hypothetical protein
VSEPIREHDPRYSLVQDMIEGDAARQDAAAVKLQRIDRLVQNAEDVAAQLTEKLIPDDLRAAGYRFVFDTTPIPVTREDT